MVHEQANDARDVGEGLAVHHAYWLLLIGFDPIVNPQHRRQVHSKAHEPPEHGRMRVNDRQLSDYLTKSLGGCGIS